MATWQADEVSGDAANSQRITFSWPALNLKLELEVQEVVPEERLVLGVGQSRLVLEIEEGAVCLSHTGLRSEDEAEGMRSAWQASLGLMAHGLALHPGRKRRVHWITQHTRTSAALAHTYFTDRQALSQWLTRSGSIGAPQSSLELQLLTGEPVTGSVYANTIDRDVAFSWSEQQNSFLVLRTFPSPRNVDERLLAISWSRWHEEPFPEPLTRLLAAAIGRLAQLLQRRGLA
jgi:hypothetical protein